ncbi:parafibromin [Drosophila takahashii]|uniref:parafibromin n=1 Tax=Drosophila takahashii TaxID=29030 RepID=UPI003899178F
MDPNSKTLSQTMTVEAIAAIKAKRLAMKRELDVEGKRLRMMQREQERREQELQADEVCRRAIERERPHRTREEQLLGEKELHGVLECVSRVYDFERRRMRPKPLDPPPAMLREEPVVPPQLETVKPASKCKYNRYGQERFLKGQQEFGINPQGSNLEKATSSGLNPGSSQRGKTKSADVNTSNGDPRKFPRYYKPLSRMPIIVVPAALTSLVTLHNAKQLLQEMRYVSVEQARQSMNVGQHLDELIIEHRFQGELLSYRVIDNVTRLTSGEWDRVAAVFAMGPHWQFKGWPQGGDPALIFHQVCAFHLHFKDSPVCKELRNLQVHPLALSPHERHSDCGILTEFWNKLDRHMAVHPRQFAFIKQK